MAFSSFLRRLSPNQQEPLLPINSIRMSQYPTTTSEVTSISQAPNKVREPSSHMESMSSEENQDSILDVSRHERHLQDHLQCLLDAQSEGLLSGLGRSSATAQDIVIERKDTTPTLSYSTAHAGFQRATSVTPVRQPTKKKIGLRGARRGILRTIHELAALKSQQGELLESQLASREEDSKMVQRFSAKKDGLQAQIKAIENEDNGRKVQEFRQEEKVLDADIKETESRLWEMKARQRHLLGKIEGLNNSVQSKLSSYNAALTLAENETRDFLARPAFSSPTTEAAGKEGLWALPASRRTLQMASEHFHDEREKLEQRSSNIDMERVALQDGAVMWEDVIMEVTALEKVLQEEMQRLQSLQALEGRGTEGATDGMKTVLKHMERTRSRIESQLTIARACNWKLLVCCIGAELEAIIEGYGVLLKASDNLKNMEKDGASGDEVHGEGKLLHENIPQPGEHPDVQDTLSGPQGYSNRMEDDDDGPGPDLLISQGEDE